MERVRLASPANVPIDLPCGRCGKGEGCWDRIAGKAYCPDCQEMLAVGEGEPLIEPTERRACAVCGKRGVVCFHTFPLKVRTPIGIDLCPEHLRWLLGRRLSTYAYLQLRRQLQALNIDIQAVFLLHEAFYDPYGQALQPAIDLN